MVFSGNLAAVGHVAVHGQQAKMRVVARREHHTVRNQPANLARREVGDEDDLPAEWADYYTANVEFFQDIGSPGGAAKTGVIKHDHPIIAALPPQA